MNSATPVPLSETLRTPLGAGIAVYLLIGFLVVGFIVVRGMKLRRPPRNGILWDKKDNARNGLFLFQNIVFLSPIAFIVEMALWPLVLLFLWAFQADEDEDIQPCDGANGGPLCVHVYDDFHTPTPSNARPRPPSLILFSLDVWIVP